ncbi:MAG: glycerol-3-phosphate 1-O-acyltransferase PlsY [Ruminococcaceae bacterium]|nr:glycerol-3-phosphate 1-O-acyltransferase PlsY [Oscillospiraceae bacterium]
MKFIILNSVLSYLVGSVSFAVILSKKLTGKDVRTSGSGNAGATNVLRTSGKKAAATVFLLDFLKGFIAVIITRCFVMFFEAPYECVYFAGFFAQVGHCFPVFFAFRGGKGVATAAGAATAIMPVTAAVLIAVFAVIALITKTASIASCTCAVLYPLLAYFMTDGRNIFNFMFAASCSVLIIIMHGANIARLLDGEEKPVSSK